MFRELGEFITRHPLAIIAVWVVILILAVPLAATFSERLSYNVESFIPKDLESVKARDLYDAQFPDTSKAQIIVAVQSDNGSASATFVNRLNASVYGNGSIKNITSTTSIYDVQAEALAEASPDLHRGLHDLYENVSEASEELYNGTDELLNASRDLYDLRDNVTEINSGLGTAWGQAAGASQQMYDARAGIVESNAGMYQMKGIADVLFGIPDRYAVSWHEHDGISDPVQRMAAANGDVAGWIGSQIPSSNQPLAYGYLQGFNGTWSSGTPTDLSDARAAANGIVKSGYAEGFINGNVPAENRPMMLGVLNALTISKYNDPEDLQEAIVTMALQAGGLTEADRPRLNAIYGLGPNPPGAAVDSLTLSFATAGMSEADAGQARALYARGNNRDSIWDYVLDQALAGQDNDTVREIIRDSWALGRSVTNETFDKYVLDYAGKDLNDSERAELGEIYSWGPEPDASVVRAYILDEAGKDLNDTERELIAEVYDLGRDPGNGTLRAYAVDKANEELEISGNLTYFHALLDLGRNETEPGVEAFARQWAGAHDATNPRIMPASVIESLAKGQLTMYVISLSDMDDSLSAKQSVVKTREYVKGLLAEDEFRGLKAFVTGSPAMSLDSEESAMADVENIDKISVVLILILLGLYFRSFLTPLLPLAIIGIAVVIALGLLHLLSYSIGMYYLILTFVVVIMLGAGTDYCVFTLSRYAEERAAGREKKEAIVTSVEHACKSVASSGLTAMIGFAALAIIDQGVFGGIGLSVAVGIATAILVATTLLPAVLTLAGDRVFWPRKLFNSGNNGISKSFWSVLTRRVLGHSRLIFALAVVISVPAIVLVSQISLGNDFVAMMAPGLESKQGFDAINAEFGSGQIDRLLILVTLPEKATDASGNYTGASLETIERISGIMAGVNHIDEVQSPTRPEGTTINYQNLSAYPMIEREYYKAYMNESLGADNRTIAMYASMKGSPYSIESQAAIEGVRAELARYGSEAGIATIVGGSPAGIYDYQKSCTTKYPFVYLAVFVGIFLVLMALLRSVFTPLRLIITLTMSVFWTIALYILVFQMNMGYETTWILPIFLFCALMGLGVDYDIFLVSRVREEVMKGKTDEDAILTAVESTGTIITLCGAVMASAFGAMLISSSIELKEFGFVLVVAIIMDATIIRLVLVPAIMVLMKKYNWWMPFIGSTTTKR